MTAAEFGITDSAFAADVPLQSVDERYVDFWLQRFRESEVSSLERETGFKFPDTYVNECREHNGGRFGGWVIFNSEVCRGLIFTTFLGFAPEHSYDRSVRKFILRVVLADEAAFRSGELSDYIPFAQIPGSLAETEQQNPWATDDSYLAFKKPRGEVFLVSVATLKASELASSYDEFLDGCAFLGGL